MFEKKECEVDEILPFVGEFSRFQIVVEILLCILIIPQTLQVLIMYFAALNSPWRCAANSTRCSFPRNETFNTDSTDYKARCDMERSDWEFVESKDFSIVTTYDLYCGTEIYTLLTTSLYFVGCAFGAIILGIASDKFGRLKVFFPSQAVVIIIGFLSVFSPNFWVFLTTRVIVGFFTSGACFIMFILASEFVGERYRPLCGILLWAAFALGLVLLGFQAYLIRNWKTLFIVCTAPYIFVLAFFRFIPESVRWLNLNGKGDEAMMVLRRIAKFNNKEISNEITLIPPKQDENSSGSLLDLFRSLRMAKQTLVQFYAWIVMGLVYYGLALAADDLGGEIYRDYILASLVEFPAVLLAIYLCNRCGRKNTVIGSMALASAACISVAFIPKNKDRQGLMALRVIVGMIGKLGISVSFDAIYTWSVELHPTIIRSRGMGLLEISSPIGGASAPLVAKGLKSVHHVLPFLVMGASSFIASALMLLLQETKGKSTAEVIEDGKERGKNLGVEFHRDPHDSNEKVNLGYPHKDECSKL